MHNKLLILNLPNHPNRAVDREYAGGFGIGGYARKNVRNQSLNLFLPYAACVAEKIDWEYRIIDSQASGLSLDKTLYEIKKFDPQIVFSMISLPSIQNDIQLLNTIKGELPDTLVVGCGTVCKVMPREILTNSKIDILFRGEIPYLSNLTNLLVKFKQSVKRSELKKLLGVSFRKGSEIIVKQLEKEKTEIDNYHPSYDALQLDKYARFTDLDGKERLFIPILASRGCPHNCIYCPYPLGFGKNLVVKSSATIVDEIEMLYRNYGVKGFLFRSQCFTQNSKWTRRVCNELIKRKLDITWICEARVDEVSKDILTVMKKSGCQRIHYGVETGDSDLISIGKPRVDLRSVSRAFKLTKKLGIWAHAHIILGLPGENWNSINKTRSFLANLDPDSINLNFATPYPGTGLYKIAEKKNLIMSHDWSDYTSNDAIMRTDELDLSDLYHARYKFAMDFFKRKAFSALSNPFDFNSMQLLAKYYVPRIIGEKLRQLRGNYRVKTL